MSRPRASAPDTDDLAVLERFRARKNPGGYSRDGVVADVVNRAAIATTPWQPSSDKVFISDVYDTIVRDGADDGVSLEELKRELVRLNKLGLVELVRADFVPSMPHAKVVASETDAGGATFHFIVRPRQNPYVGSHPDLFGPSTHDQYQRRPGPVHDKPHTLALHLPIDPAAQRAKRAAGPESPMFVPLSDLTSEQIRELKRAQFTDQEWAELDEDDREYIEENDEESQARVDALADVFIDRWKWEKDENRSNFERIEETFEHTIREKARTDSLHEWCPERLYDRLVVIADRNGMDGAAFVDSVLNNLLSNTNEYEYTTERYGGGHIVYSEEIRGDVYLHREDWAEAMAEMTSDEVQRAINKISDDTDGDIDLVRKDLDKHDLQFDFDTGITVYAKIDTDSLEQRVLDDIHQEVEDQRSRDEDQFEDPAHAPGVEERIVYRWPDGFYVLDLLPSELPEEGKAMGMCVGRPDMGYGRAVREGEIKILSVRSPSGKPLFTIEAERKVQSYDPDTRRYKVDKIVRIDQVKGKANRLPGFDLGKTAPGTPLKKDEVVRIYELIEGPGGLGEKFGLEQAVDDITDLKPAAREVNLLCRQGDKWATQLLQRLGIEEPRAVYYPGAEPGPRENPAPACGRHGEGCTGFCAPYRKRNARANPSPKTYIHYSSRPEAPQVPPRAINKFAGGSGPLGVYTYPSDATVPHTFGAERPYVFHLTPTVPVLDTSKYTQEQLDHDLQRLAELEDISRPLRLHAKYADEIGATRPGYPPFAKLWYVLSRIPNAWQIKEGHLPGGTGEGFANAKRGRELLIELGYPAIEDRRGIMYASEPQQAVFLTDDSFTAEPAN